MPEDTHRMTHGRRRIYVRLLVLLGVALGGWLAAGAWLHRSEDLREAAAVKTLQGLGVIVVMDGDGGHAATVNLSTIQSDESLSKAIGQLPYLTHITAIDASRTGIRDEQLDYLSRLSGLKSLALNETRISNPGLNRLSALRELEALYLASTQVTDQGLWNLASLSALRILDISAIEISTNLSPLAQLPELE